MSGGAPLYDKMFRRLEAARWRLADVPFDEVDTSRVSEQSLQAIEVNCLMELSSLYAVRMFLRDFREIPDFCQFASIWYYEEMKHYLVLREYLKVFDRAPDTDQFQELDTELAPSPWPPTLALHYCSELRLGMWYHRWSEEAEEPVLAGIYREIGNDEFRHAACYRDFMEQALERDPRLLLQFLQAAKWMLVNPSGDKHPTTMDADADGAGSVTDRIDGYNVMRDKVQRTIRDEDEQRLRRRVLATLSRLSGRELNSMMDLSALTRELQRSGCAVPAADAGTGAAASP